MNAKGPIDSPSGRDRRAFPFRPGTLPIRLCALIVAFAFCDAFVWFVCEPSSNTFACKVMSDVLGRSRGHRVPHVASLVIREGGILRVSPMGSDDAERATASPRAGEQVVGEAHCLIHTPIEGFMAPVWNSFDHRVLVLEIPGVAPMSASERSEVRRSFVESILGSSRWASSLTPEYRALLASSDGYTTRTNPVWLVHDLIVGPMLAWALISAIATLPSVWRKRSENARMARGCCAMCGYSLRGLDGWTIRKCPECGHPRP